MILRIPERKIKESCKVEEDVESKYLEDIWRIFEGDIELEKIEEIDKEGNKKEKDDQIWQKDPRKLEKNTVFDTKKTDLQENKTKKAPKNENKNLRSTEKERKRRPRMCNV